MVLSNIQSISINKRKLKGLHGIYPTLFYILEGKADKHLDNLDKHLKYSNITPHAFPQKNTFKIWSKP